MARSIARNLSRESAPLRVRLPVRLSIGEPLPGCAADCQSGPLNIVDAELDAMRVAKIELGEVAVQMRCGNVVIGTDDAALEYAEIPFDSISMRVASYVFLD